VDQRGFNLSLRRQDAAVPGLSPDGADIITEIRREAALLKTGALQNAILSSANFSSIATDEKGIIQLFNVGAERMLGYTASEVVDKMTPAGISDPRELIARAETLSLELATPVLPGFEALVFKASRGIEDTYEMTYIRKDGTRFPAVVSVSALRDAQNAIIGYLLIGTDNTARRQAEEALLRVGALQTAIFTSANFSSIATDAKGVIRIFNVGAERMLGYTAAEVMNKITPAEISDPLDLIARAETLSLELATPITPGFEALVSKASRGIEDIYELTYIRKDGSRFPAVVSVTALRDAQNAIIGYLLIGIDNTARKQASQYARSLLEASLDPLVTISPEGKITDVNEGSIKVTGVARGTLIGSDFSDYFTEPDQAREGYQQVFAKGFVTDYPLTIRHADGRLTDVLYNASIYKDVHGNVLGVFAAARDITDRKQAENKFRSLFESVPDALVVVNRSGEIMLVNSQTERAFGYTRSELLGKKVESLVPERFRGRHGEHRSGYFSDPKVRLMAGTNRSLSALRKDGTEFPVEISLSSLDTEDGRLVSAAIRDVTDRKEASQYARSLLEASLDPLVTISAEGTITDVNEGSVKVTGVARENLIGTDFSNYFTEPEKAREGYQQVFARGFVTDYPLTIRHKDGRLTDVLYNASVYKDVGGSVLGVFAAARDVTERKRFEKTQQENNIELVRAKAAAEKANLAKSDFLSSMSHELRSPLNAILGFAQLMISDTPAPTPAQVASIEPILNAGWYLLELINEILDLAQIESGKLALSIEPTSLAEVMLECQAMIEPQGQKRGLKMSFPAFDIPCFVNADRTRLKQVIINLLSNAIKYNRANGTVAVRCSSSTPERVRISVRDSGAGLSPDMIKQLFQSFNRLGRETSAEEGTGIGLVMSKRLVELMGGTIGVESTVGSGSVFWFELNSAPDPHVAVKDTRFAEIAQTNVQDGVLLRTLLYVEDNPANLKLVELLIARRPDLRLLTASDGDLGIQLARANHPDVILMDINLPGISGVDALKILRGDPLTMHIPVVAISANAMPQDIEKGLSFGFFGYVTKPIRVNEFLSTLDMALEFAALQLPASAATGPERVKTKPVKTTPGE